jgi:hypothetical protein
VATCYLHTALHAAACCYCVLLLLLLLLGSVGLGVLRVPTWIRLLIG